MLEGFLPPLSQVFGGCRLLFDGFGESRPTLPDSACPLCRGLRSSSRRCIRDLSRRKTSEGCDAKPRSTFRGLGQEVQGFPDPTKMAMNNVTDTGTPPKKFKTHLKETYQLMIYHGLFMASALPIARTCENMRKEKQTRPFLVPALVQNLTVAMGEVGIY